MIIFPQKKNRGFTFVEMLVVLSIFALVVGAIVSSVLFFYRSNSYVMEQAYAISEGRKGIENMVQDIREATYSEVGDYLVEEINHHKIVFYGDVDDDDEVEKVKYSVEDKELKRATADLKDDLFVYPDSYNEISVISENVRNIENDVKTFIYYDKQGNKMTEDDFENIMDAAFVKVNLVVNVDPYDKPRKFTIRSSATLRNVE